MISSTSDPPGPAEAGERSWSSAWTTRSARWLLLGTVFVPLVLYRGVYFPFVTTRALLFRLLVELAAVILLWQLLVREVEVPDRRDPVLWALGAWVGAGLLSAVLGPATHHSLFGGMERMWGVTQWAHLGLFYLLVRVYFDGPWWDRFLRATLMVSVAVGLYALGEVGVAHAHEWVYGTPRVGSPPVQSASTLGNSGYLAAYGLVHLAVAGAVFRGGRAGWRAFAALAAGVSAASFALGGSRALLIGVGLGALLAAVPWAWTRWREGERGVPWGRLGLGAGAAALLLVGVRAAGLLPPLAELPVVGRLADLGQGLGVIRRRMIAWEAGLEAFIQRPLSGWGVENFHLAFDRFADPEFYRTGRPFNWDRAHNVFVGALAGAGTLGAVAYGALWVAAGARVRRSWREGLFSRPLSALLTLGVAAYLFYLLFWFEDHSSFFPLLAVLAWVRFEGEGGAAVRLGPVRPAEVPRRRLLRRGVLIGAVVLAGGLAWRAASTGRAARLIVRGVAAPGPVPAVEAYEAARRLQAPQERDVATQYASFVGRWGRGASERLRQGANRELFARAVGGAEQAMNRSIARAPSDERLLLSRSELAIGAYAGSGLEEAYRLAVESAGGAIAIAPDRLHYYGLLATYRWVSGRREEALEALERGLERYPAYGGLYRRRGRLHREAGRRDSALLDLRRSLWLGHDVEETDLLERVAAAEAEAGRPARGAELLADWAAARYLPALWGRLDRPERGAFLAEVGLPAAASSYRRYAIRPEDLPLVVRWSRYAREAGDPHQARLAAKVALNGLSESRRTARLREAILPLAAPEKVGPPDGGGGEGSR